MPEEIGIMAIRIIQGDCRLALQELASESVHCVVTSPPYWRLRDYGVAGQIGLEPSHQDYVATLVAVFRQVHRVLRKDGTLWLSLGDSYAGSGNISGSRQGNAAKNGGVSNRNGLGVVAGLKPKDLVGIPWRVAFALQADGWYLRQDIIWSKPNPMPESIVDRCTKAHEYIFLLSKHGWYYYDAEAIAEPAQERRLTTWDERKANGEPLRRGDPAISGHVTRTGTLASKLQRNKRSVWEITTAPFPEAHFATFPPALVEPCILAGCPKDGTVLDPFGGAGTTGLVADRLQRNAILIELNSEYGAMAERRLRGDAGMFASIVTE
jgi:DNA modification methylase